MAGDNNPHSQAGHHSRASSWIYDSNHTPSTVGYSRFSEAVKKQQAEERNQKAEKRDRARMTTPSPKRPTLDDITRRISDN
uniref:Uncharacterized protein n=1 Tax=Steinernema glaseri TaxID=37863 RepID=A0A1I7Z3T1_9BILA